MQRAIKSIAKILTLMSLVWGPASGEFLRINPHLIENCKENDDTRTSNHDEDSSYFGFHNIQDNEHDIIVGMFNSD